MNFNTIVNITENGKREDFSFLTSHGIFNVTISYYGGMFLIELYGGWNSVEHDFKYGFGTGFCGDEYRPGFDAALQAALNDIRNCKINYLFKDADECALVKDAAESALARACVEFQLKHRGML